jgi:xanthine dehydrogenase small subunit
MGDHPDPAGSVANTAIRFVLDGKIVAVRDLSPQTTLLEYLREHLGRTGTKEGCAEGDCGACTVVLAQAHGDGGLAWRPINACIRPLPTVDGKALYTVESLKHPDGGLHPVQQAMVDCHASQCGFCTPGFVMSLFGLYKNAHQPGRPAIDDALSGNLCRCTGYRPIIAAGERMGELPAPAGWRAPGVDPAGKRMVSDEERAVAAMLAPLERDRTFAYEHGGQQFFAPTTIAELAALRVAHPDARIVAGATDVGLWVTKQHRDLGTMLYTGNVRELLTSARSRSHLEIGAAVTLSDAFALLNQDFPLLAEVWTRFASVPIRNAGTLGGNIANGSPIGDSMPVLFALGATVLLRRGDAQRELPLEAFYLDYQKTALAPGEFVAQVRIPRASAGSDIRAYKVSKRFDQDISAVFACFAMRLEAGRVQSIRIGVGGMAALPKRALKCEQALAGQPWGEATIAAAQAALDADFAPLSDMRATAGYRRVALRNLLQRYYIETSQPDIATRVLDCPTP